MGHTPGFPCLVEDPDHDGQCSTPIEVATPAQAAGFVDLDQTRYFEVTESTGGTSCWRSNETAPVGVQVEHLRPEGWRTSLAFDTERAFLAYMETSPLWTLAERVMVDE